MNFDEAKAIVLRKYPDAISEYMPSKARWFLRKSAGGLVIPGSGTDGDEVCAWLNASMRIDAFEKAMNTP